MRLVGLVLALWPLWLAAQPQANPQDMEAGAYEDPEFLKNFEALGESIVIRDGCHESKQLKVIVREGKKAAN